jgi:hypothetical protein
MHELATGAVRTIHLLMVLLAKLGLVSGRDVLLLLELIVTMGKGATVCESASACLFPVLAHLIINVYFAIYV